MDADLKFETDCRKLLLQRLQTPLNTLNRTRDKELAAHDARVSSLAEYESPEAAHEAFGYGYITEDEYRKVCEHFETGEQIRAGRVTKTGAAIEMLQEFMVRLKREIKDFEWEALPEEERERIRQAEEKWKEEHSQRRD